MLLAPDRQSMVFSRVIESPRALPIRDFHDLPLLSSKSFITRENPPTHVEFNSFWQRFLSVDVREEMPPSQKNKIYITRGASLLLALLGPVFMSLNIAYATL